MTGSHQSLIIVHSLYGKGIDDTTTSVMADTAATTVSFLSKFPEHSKFSGSVVHPICWLFLCHCMYSGSHIWQGLSKLIDCNMFILSGKIPMVLDLSSSSSTASHLPIELKKLSTYRSRLFSTNLDRRLDPLCQSGFLPLLSALLGIFHQPFDLLGSPTLLNFFSYCASLFVSPFFFALLLAPSPIIHFFQAILHPFPVFSPSSTTFSFLKRLLNFLKASSMMCGGCFTCTRL